MKAGIRDFLEQHFDKAFEEASEVKVEYKDLCSFHSARVELYNIIRVKGLKDQVKIRSLEPDLFIVPLVKPELKSITDKQTACVNQVITRIIPDGAQLNAYRVLLDKEIVVAVEILGWSEDEFRSAFPYDRAFLIRNTKRGLLLL